MVYKSAAKIYGKYWIAYGGWQAMKRSPYLHAAIVLLVLTTPFWVCRAWWEQVISVIPSLLGFTLGGFAMFLGFGNKKFLALLAEVESFTRIAIKCPRCKTVNSYTAGHESHPPSAVERRTHGDTAHGSQQIRNP
jgi:phage FluMu protein Com